MTWRIQRNMEIEKRFFFYFFFCFSRFKYSVCHILHRPGNIWLKNKCVKRQNEWNGRTIRQNGGVKIDFFLVFYLAPNWKERFTLNNDILTTGLNLLKSEMLISNEFFIFEFVKIYWLFKLIFGLAINVWYDGNWSVAWICVHNIFSYRFKNGHNLAFSKLYID